jgi:hypothetical protein
MGLRIVAAGIASREIFRVLQRYDTALVEARVMSDIEAAKAVKRGEADYYLGACYSGQGGALAAAIAVLGYAVTAMVGVPGRGTDRVRITDAVERGVKAFGMTHDQIAEAVPIVVDLLLQRYGLTRVTPRE